MLGAELKEEWITGLRDGSIIPYLGPGVLADVTAVDDGRQIPATSDQLILAMNNGRPMSPKLMYEFPRAAMNVELKRGRSAVTRFLDTTYGKTQWTRGAIHEWLKDIRPNFVIDINRDTQLLDSYANTPHVLILGCARMGGSQFRFKIFVSDGESYSFFENENVPTGLPMLFKPMGAPKPESTYVASDADYVDYITELMGGFAIPGFMKKYRKEKRYLLLGMSLRRDSERMVLSDIMYGAAQPTGWIMLQEATAREQRFCKKMGLEIIDAPLAALVAESREAVAA